MGNQIGRAFVISSGHVTSSGYAPSCREINTLDPARQDCPEYRSAVSTIIFQHIPVSMVYLRRPSLVRSHSLVRRAK